MINLFEVNETNKMIEQENLDVRTITMGISLLDCIDSDIEKVNENIYNKIKKYAANLVETGEQISKEFGIPVVNKRISVTPIALVGGAACKTIDDYVSIAKTLDKVATEVGISNSVFKVSSTPSSACFDSTGLITYFIIASISSLEISPFKA